jgi:hypothetical protein
LGSNSIEGSFGGWQNPAGNSPIFRSYDPTLESKRYFPKLANVLNNVNTIGELKPSKARVLNFRLTARDNQTGGGGVTYAEDKAVVNVNKNKCSICNNRTKYYWYFIGCG